MTDTTIGAVYVKAPAGSAGAYTFPWSAAWEPCPRLIPTTSVAADGGRDRATFRVLRRIRRDPGEATPTDHGEIVCQGLWVCILHRDTAGMTEGERWAETNVAFLGQIENIPETELFEDGDDWRGTATAIGIGMLWRSSSLRGWRAVDGRVLDNPPSFNVRRNGGKVIGNAGDGSSAGLEATHVIDGTPSTFPLFGFEIDPSLTGTLFSRRSALMHIVSLCAPLGLPAAKLRYTTDVQYWLQRTDEPEVIEVRQASLGEAVDLIVGGGALRWKLAYAGGDLYLDIYTVLDSTVGTLPAATADDVVLPATTVSARCRFGDSADPYDLVEVIGRPIVWCCTWSYYDGTMFRGWSDDQQTAWKAAESASDWEANRIRRAQPDLDDVFQRLVLAYNSTGELQVRDEPGNNTSSLILACPSLLWNDVSGLLTIQTDNRAPVITAGRVLPWIPWYVGLRTSLSDPYFSDTRTPAQQAVPRPRSPRIFMRWGADEITDLLAPDAEVKNAEIPTVLPDDYQPGLIVRWRESITAAGDDYDPDTDGVQDHQEMQLEYNWQQYLCTVAVESDQRLLTYRYAPAIAALPLGDRPAAVRRRLTIERNYHCWIVRRGTIIGVKGNRGADRLAGNAFVRNDYPLAQRELDEASAWAFRSRRSATVTTAYPVATATPLGWQKVGQLVADLIQEDAAGATVWTRELNAVVEAVEIEWSQEAPRITTTLGVASLPQRSGPGSAPGGSLPTTEAAVRSLGGAPTPAIYEVGQRVTILEATPRPTEPGKTRQEPERFFAAIDGWQYYGDGTLRCAYGWVRQEQYLSVDGKLEWRDVEGTTDGIDVGLPNGDHPAYNTVEGHNTAVITAIQGNSLPGIHVETITLTTDGGDGPGGAAGDQVTLVIATPRWSPVGAGNKVIVPVERSLIVSEDGETKKQVLLFHYENDALGCVSVHPEAPPETTYDPRDVWPDTV